MDFRQMYKWFHQESSLWIFKMVTKTELQTSWAPEPGGPCGDMGDTFGWGKTPERAKNMVL
jgi:hypothetical protein